MTWVRSNPLSHSNDRRDGYDTGAMAFLDWKLAIIVAPLMPIFFYIQRRYRFLLRRSGRRSP